MTEPGPPFDDLADQNEANPPQPSGDPTTPSTSLDNNPPDEDDDEEELEDEEDSDDVDEYVADQSGAVAAD